MTTIISVVSQKGGAGKSTIARLLAVEGARSQQVKIADLDLMQGTSTNWNMRRQRSGRKPIIEVQTFGAVDQATRNLDGLGLLIFDGAPHASTQTSQAARRSDLVVIPTKPTLDDLMAALTLGRELVSKGTDPSRVLFVVNQTTDSGAEVAEARQWLLEGGFPVTEGHIPLKTGYSRALDAGDALSEAKHPSLQARARIVTDEIFDYLRSLKGED